MQLPSLNSLTQIEIHPYVFKASEPVLEYMKQVHVLPASFGGLTPVARFPEGPVDPILSRIAVRLTEVAGIPVTPAQVLQLWLRKKGIPYVT